MLRAARASAMVGLLIGSGAAHAQSTPADPDRSSMAEVLIFGRGEELIGRADAASEGAVGGADLSVRPLLRVAELLEAVPGLIAAQHSGSGKANQYFLRGFNLDHGTDFTSYVDDVPWNLRTHGHGQGYLDVNGLIPETVERIDYRKGTYRADTGDFAMAGSALMSTVDHLDPFIGVEGGQYGWTRAAAGGSRALADGELTVAGQWKTYDGPWQLDENLQHEALWAKYAKQTRFGALELTGSAYHATWNPTEQIPERAIGTSVCADEFCVLDPTAEGETLRWIGAARLSGEDWRATLYGQYYDWQMSSNPTYDFQINQFDRRWIAGGRYERTFELAPALSLKGGSELRYDDIGNVGVSHTEEGIFVDPISRHSVKESSIGVYTEGTWTPLSRLRILGGLRADRYDFDVTARDAGLVEGSEQSSQLSPKLGAAYQLSPLIELYGNWGKGFNSNDARGVVNRDTPVPGLVAGTGYEGGARFEIGDVKLTVTQWWLNLSSELKFVGDSNSVEPGSATRRRGYEIVGFWRPASWLALDAVWTGSHARYRGNPDGTFVAGAVEEAAELGFSAHRNVWELSGRLRYLGPYPLIEDNSVRAGSEVTVNLRAAWNHDRYSIYGELLNVLDENGKDIVYYYAAHVEGLDPPGEQVDGRVSRAGEPRTVRIGVKFTLDGR
jgi:outer membrane receptor protein involved in Fe transport